MQWQLRLSAVVVSMAAWMYPVQAEIPATERTADMPDSWLVLYNADPASEGPAWVQWYIQQWGIPSENTLALQVPADERIHRDTFRSQIFYPVRNYLNANPSLKARIMGIIVGYRVPGNFYLDDTHPPMQGGGGWSVTNNLTDLTYDTWYKRANPHTFVASASPNTTRLTKAALSTECYLTARLDGPSLAAVTALTERARAISDSPSPLLSFEHLYQDFVDIGAPAGDEWPALRAAVQSPYTNTPPWRFPWLQYESENEPMPSCALAFSYYRITGWDTVPWLADPSGSRVAAMACNSWGATTVRSTTNHRARFVPNALFNGGFAAAIGATAEPYTGSEPQPSTIVWSLAEGRTLGEACFQANPYRNFMWELVGDPLLRVPLWAVDPCQILAPPKDQGPAELVSGQETIDVTPTLHFSLMPRCGEDFVAFRLQIAQDPTFADPEIEFVSDVLPQGPAAFTVGQVADAGTYIVGAEGQELALGSYFWRVRAEDQMGTSDWAPASPTSASFVVAEPLFLVRAVSRKIHAGVGPLDIELALSPGLPPTTEPRRAGPLRLVIEFNKPIQPADGILDSNEVQTSPGVLEGIAIQDNQLTLNINGVPDRSLLSVLFPGIADMAGRGTTSCLLLAICEGDVNNSNQLNTIDLSVIKAHIDGNVNPISPRCDINLSGTVNTIDMADLKAKLDSGAG